MTRTASILRHITSLMFVNCNFLHHLDFLKCICYANVLKEKVDAVRLWSDNDCDF